MAMTLKWDGLSELRKMLAAMPVELREPAQSRVFAHAGRAAASLRAAA